MRKQIRSYLSVAFILPFVLLKGQILIVSIVNAKPTSIITAAYKKGSKQHSSLFIENHNSSLVNHVATIPVKNNYTDYLLNHHANDDLGDSNSPSPPLPVDEKESSRPIGKIVSIGSKFSPSPTNFPGKEEKNTGSLGNTENPTVSPFPSSISPATFKRLQRKTAQPSLGQTSVASIVTVIMIPSSDAPTSDQTPKSSREKPKNNRCDCSMYSKGRCKKCTALFQLNESARSDNTNHICAEKKCVTLCCDLNSEAFFETTVANSMSYSSSTSKQKKKKGSTPSMSTHDISPSLIPYGVAKEGDLGSTGKPLQNHAAACACSNYTSKNCKQCSHQHNVKKTSFECGKKKCVKRCCKSQSESFFHTATSGSMSYLTTSSEKDKKKEKHNPKDSSSSSALYNINTGREKDSRKTATPTSIPTTAKLQSAKLPSSIASDKVTRRPKAKNKKNSCRCSKYNPESCRKCIAGYNLGKNKRKDAVNNLKSSCGKKKCVRRCCGSIKEDDSLNSSASSCLSYKSSKSEKKMKQNHKKYSSPLVEPRSIF
jgi:hypothetical protein